MIVGGRVSTRCIFTEKIVNGSELYLVIKKKSQLKRSRGSPAGTVSWTITPSAKRPVFTDSKGYSRWDGNFKIVYVGKAASPTHIDGYGPPPGHADFVNNPSSPQPSTFAPNMEIFLRV